MPKRRAPDEGDAYGSQKYWQDRYAAPPSDRTSEWLFSWPQLKPLFRTIPRDAAIVDLGCGTSDLCFHLAGAFRGRIVGVDNAPAAIDDLRRQQARWPGPNARRAELEVVDALKLHETFDKAAGGTFDVAVDKSTLDAMLCDQKRGPSNVSKMYRSLSSVLRPTATVFIVSWRQPENGLEWLVEGVLPALVEGCPLPGCASAPQISPRCPNAATPLRVHACPREMISQVPLFGRHSCRHGPRAGVSALAQRTGSTTTFHPELSSERTPPRHPFAGGAASPDRKSVV